MEKESFQSMDISSLLLQNTTEESSYEESVAKLPIPSELPKSPDLSHLPEEILRSGTVETLIHQNEDLLSRLSISLRRNSQLEEKISQIEKRNRILEHQYSNMNDQLLVFKKKNELIDGKYAQYEETISRLKNDLRLFETQYAELYSTSSSQIIHFKEKLNLFSRRLGRYFKYRKKIGILSEKIREKIYSTENENSRLLTQIATMTETQNSLRINIEKSIERLQEQDKFHKEELLQMTDSYENQMSHLNQQLQISQSEFKEANGELQKAKVVFEKNIDLENQIVLKNRKIDELKVEADSEIQRLQVELKQFRQEAKERSLDLQNSNQEVFELTESVSSLKNEKNLLESQVESLQILWRDTNNEIEKLKEKNTSLQKLNQQISITLNDTRKTLQKERDSKETLNFKTKETIKEMESQILLLSKQVISTENAKTTQHTKIKPQVIQYLQTLVAEIQSGVESHSVSSSESNGDKPDIIGIDADV